MSPKKIGVVKKRDNTMKVEDFKKFNIEELLLEHVSTFLFIPQFIYLFL